MSRIPVKIADFINWASSHGPLWDTNHVALGLSTTQSAAFKTAAANAAALFAARLTAAELAKAATLKQTTAVADARRQAADCIRTIAGFAGTQADPSAVYALAQIDPPRPAQPAPPPGVPTDFKAGLENNGGVTITWKADNGGSVGATVWTVARRTGAFVGAVGRRTFTDNTIPAGVTNVQYQVFGQRAEAVGQTSLPFTVQFGTGGDGLTISAQFSEAEAPAAKLAA
jgi:hypothetical protein